MFSELASPFKYRDLMNDSKPTRGERLGYAFWVFLWVLLVVVIGVPLLFIAWIMLSPGFSQEPNRRVITDPVSEFQQSTGLTLPVSASVVSSGDVWIDFLGDGEFYLVFEVNPTTLEQWLDQPPPWEQSEWKRGPISADLVWHGSFGVGGMSGDPAGGGPDHKISELEVEQVFESKQVWYVDRGTTHDEMRWRNGQVLIIDPEHNRVWYSSWKF